MKRFSRPVTLALLGSLALITTSAVIYAGHAWSSYHWEREMNPLMLDLGDNLSGPNWSGHLSDATADWNHPEYTDWAADPVLKLTIVAGETNPKRCRPTSGRVEVCNSTYGLNGWLGLAQIWISGGHITQGVAKVNDSYFNLSSYNNSVWRQLVMCQEIAHTFGLGHQDENFTNTNLGTCMDYTDLPDESSAHPNYHDFEQLAAIYSVGDEAPSGGGYTPGGGMGMGNGMGAGQPEGPPGLNQFEVGGPGEWGQMIASSPDGRTAVFEIDFGNGQRILTFVIWA